MLPDATRLIVFTRFPEPGRTKTRLIGHLGAEGAAGLQREMTAHTLAQAREFRARCGAEVEVRYVGGDEPRMAAAFGGDFCYVPQGGGDLGDRMARAVEAAFQSGAAAALVIGSDCPGVTADLLGRAVAMLREDARRLVLGPARDGGYYLIGLSRAAPELFAGIAWSTEGVLDATVDRAGRSGWNVRTLEPLSDVDRPGDLNVWHAARQVPALSVVIPAWNEAATIARVVDSATAAAGAEVIVVDGGSRDDTAEIARSRGATVMIGPRGRARQMNAGAARARGDAFLFLHADTVLPAGYDGIIAGALALPGTIAGAFRLRIEGEHPAFRGIETLVRWRSTLGRLPYGDQAIFLRGADFRAVGGYPEIDLMEDVELVRRLNARGRIRIVPASVGTSARRWLTRGIVRTTLLNQACLLAHRLGVPTRRIARWRTPFTAWESPRDDTR